MAKRTVLDVEWLKQFIHGDFDDFRTALRKILKDDPASGPSVGFIADGTVTATTLVSGKPLAIGGLAGPVGGGGATDAGSTSPNTATDMGGQALNGAIQQAAGAIFEQLESQDKLFEDIESALGETIEKMKASQAKSLDRISSDTFMDIFEDVDTDLGSGGGGADSGKEE